MIDYDKALQQLLQSSYIAKLSLDQATRQQGIYILWLDSNPLVCLKTGMAGTRQGTGIKGRLQLHFSSNPDNTVLARHLAADTTSDWVQNYDFEQREDRQEFLETQCFFQTVALPDLSKNDLKQFENFVEAKMKPKYAGRVGG